MGLRSADASTATVMAGFAAVCVRATTAVEAAIARMSGTNLPLIAIGAPEIAAVPPPGFTRGRLSVSDPEAAAR
ncbi:MAG: hypothetical protein ACHQNA_08740 [Acidimicrobiales bacterium]